MNAVFAYGTLRDAEFQRALFDRTLTTTPATLEGWTAVVAEGGYFTIVRAAGACVSGEVVMLDDTALAVADAWEEVPLYERLRVEVRRSDGQTAACWVYVRPTESREKAPDGLLTRHGRDAVLAQIRAFRATYE